MSPKFLRRLAVRFSISYYMVGLVESLDRLVSGY
jgi:hypothetical protein